MERPDDEAEPRPQRGPQRGPQRRPQRRRRPPLVRVARALGAGLLLVALALVVTSLWLGRDPGPYFAARRATLAGVEEAWLRDEGASTSRGVRLSSESGLTVDVAVRWPEPVDAVTPPERLPLVVLLGGHRTGRDAVDLVDDLAGVVVAAIDYPYAGDPKVKGLAVVGEVPAIRRALFDTPPALMLALDWLAGLPFVDAARVDLVGVSLGAPFAVVAGAVDERYGRVWSIHGAGAPHDLIERGLEEDVPFAPLRWLVTVLALDVTGVARLAPERWVGRIAPRPFVMINGRDDDSFPPECVEVLWDAAGEPREREWTEGGHVRPKKEELVRDLVARVLARVRPERAASARPDPERAASERTDGGGEVSSE